MTRARPSVLALCFAASALCGCTTAVWVDARIDAGQALAIPRARMARDLPDKAAVLAQLGPPGDVLSPGGGDVFVYRLLRVEDGLLQLNAGLFSGVPLPVFLAYGRCSRSDDLFVFFDDVGRVVHVAHRRAVDGPCGALPETHAEPGALADLEEAP